MSLLKDFIKFDRKQTIKIFLITLISCLTSGVGIVMLLPMMSVVNIGNDSKYSFVFNYIHLNKQSEQVIFMLVLFVLIMSIHAWIEKLRIIYNSVIVEGYTKHLRLKYYNAVMSASWQTINSKKRSDLVNNIIKEIDRVSMASVYLLRLFATIVKSFVSIVIVLYMNIPITILVLVIGGGFLLCFKTVYSKTRKNAVHIKSADQALLTETSNQFNGIKEIRCYEAQDHHESIMHSVLDECEKAAVNYSRLSSWPTFILTSSASAVISVVFIIAYFGLNMSIASIAILVVVFGRLWPCLSIAQSDYQYIVSANTIFKDMKELINELEENQITKPEFRLKLDFKNVISFNNISFLYDNSDNVIIDNASFHIKKGEITAFVGKSGAGKSTLIDIILGLLTIKDGEISIDGNKIDNLQYADSIKSISYVPQDPLLINDTIKENILRFNSKISDKDIIIALKKAQIWDYISSLPDGIETVIGDNGVRLSGGEKQRIVLARALASNPQFLVLDEATSALDSENEYNIQKIIKDCKGELTILLISHRLSRIKCADHFVFIDNAIVHESDSFDSNNQISF